MSLTAQRNSPTHRSYETRIGSRKIYGLMQPDGTCLILADCEVHQNACIKFTVPGLAAVTYFETERHCRAPMHKMFPDLRIEHREILISGTSPAEFDQMNGIPLPETEEEFKLKYAPLGYTFDD